jgi:hypothetical protein
MSSFSIPKSDQYTIAAETYFTLQLPADAKIVRIFDKATGKEVYQPFTLRDVQLTEKGLKAQGIAILRAIVKHLLNHDSKGMKKPELINYVLNHMNLI